MNARSKYTVSRHKDDDLKQTYPEATFFVSFTEDVKKSEFNSPLFMDVMVDRSESLEYVLDFGFHGRLTERQTFLVAGLLSFACGLVRRNSLHFKIRRKKHDIPRMA